MSSGIIVLEPGLLVLVADAGGGIELGNEMLVDRVGLELSVATVGVLDVASMVELDIDTCDVVDTVEADGVDTEVVIAGEFDVATVGTLVLAELDVMITELSEILLWTALEVDVEALVGVVDATVELSSVRIDDELGIVESKEEVKTSRLVELKIELDDEVNGSGTLFEEELVMLLVATSVMLVTIEAEDVVGIKMNSERVEKLVLEVVGAVVTLVDGVEIDELQ